MGISGFFGKRNLSAIAVDAEFPDEIYSRTNFPLKVILTNKRRFLPAFLIRVHIGNNELLFPFIYAGRRESGYINLFSGRRGRHRIEDVHICSVFPFNFFTRCKRMDKSSDFIVFPMAKRCAHAELLEKEGLHRGEKPSDRAGYEGELISFRDYIAGDPLKYIHWKATAKTGQPKTKELSSLSHQPVIIDFEKVQIRDIEEKLSCIAYVILRLFKSNIPVELKIKNRLYTSKGLKTLTEAQVRANKIAMLKELALYDTE